ncbi:MAG TPA: DUF1501 domain-containing protein, partial [Planctomycetaceae bacterium]|nr:DUF1501 domain-containing protein [Planctomycetaceae bacterium]
MLTLSGPRMRYCDRVSRRSFLQVGGLALGGLTLPQLLRAESAGGAVGRHKSVIMVYLSGGLAHQDTFDLKPEAPAEVRGEFKPIDTSVPGLQVCELLPRMAKVMDRCTLVRSVVGQRDEHSSFQNLTGYTMGETQRDGRPNFGSLAARVLGPTHPVVPPFVDLFPTMQHRPYNSTGAGYLGPAFNQIRADGEDVASMKLRYVEHAKFSDRRRLLEQIDRFRRTVDDADIDAMDESYHRAFDVLTSSRVVEALDLEKEDPKLRDRYGRGSAKHLGDGAPMWNDQLLIARRLVEAGVRVVTVAYGFWDTHGNNFGHMKAHLPTFDAGISSLIEDLHERGLERDCSVIVWGEFGRTPKINKDAGRDHWAPVQA